MTDPTPHPEGQAGLVDPAVPEACQWPADGKIPPTGFGTRRVDWPACGSTEVTRVLTSPAAQTSYKLAVCGLHAGDAYRRGWHVVPEPAPAPPGLTVNQMNVALYHAFGVDDSGPGFRLTVLGGEFPAVEVFRHTPVDGDGMFDPQPVNEVDALMAQGMRLVPRRHAFSEFAITKLQGTRDLLRAAYADASAGTQQHLMTALANLDAALSGTEHTEPEHPITEVLALVDIGGHGFSIVADAEHDLPAGATVRLWAELIDNPHDEPDVVE